MKNIEFKSSTTKRIYRDYIKRVKKNIAILSEKDKLDMLMEINSHIFEGMKAFSDKNESDNLLTVLEKLGTPEDYLKVIVADKKYKEAVRTFNPKTVYQALFLNFKRGIIFSLFAILYLPLISFGFLIIAKIFAPTKTGLFFINGHFSTFGFISNTNGMNEMLGYWFVPLVLIAAVLFYLLITLLFRLVKKK